MKHFTCVCEVSVEMTLKQITLSAMLAPLGRAATLHVPEEGSTGVSGGASSSGGDVEEESLISPSGVSGSVTPGPGGANASASAGGGANAISGKGSASAGPLPRGVSSRKSYHSGIPSGSRPRVPTLFKKEKEASVDNDALKPRSLRYIEICPEVHSHCVLKQCLWCLKMVF